MSTCVMVIIIIINNLYKLGFRVFYYQCTMYRVVVPIVPGI